MPRTNGSGSGRPKNIQIRILNTGRDEIRVFLLSFLQNSYFGFLKLLSEIIRRTVKMLIMTMSLQEKARILSKYHFCENLNTIFISTQDSRCTGTA
jgi:hypothetical protein